MHGGDFISSVSLISVFAFDANIDQSFTFQVVGNQSVRNRLTITEAVSGSVVYSQTQETLRNQHTLPAGALSNGLSFSAVITVFDINNNEMTSAPITFITLSTPIWGFANLSANDVVRNSSFTVDIKYGQLQGELLNEYRLTLFTSTMAEIWNSGTMLGNTVPITIDGLTHSSRYFLRATGRTVNGFILDTGFIPFIVEYESVGLFAVLRLENREREASVRIQSNIVLIEGRHYPEDLEAKFIDNNMIDLRRRRRRVVFDEGFNLDGDFIIQFVGFGFRLNREVLILSDGWNNIELFWREGNFHDGSGETTPHTYVELISRPFPNYVIFSNYLEDISDTDMLHVWLRRVDGLYELKIAKL